MVLGFNLCNSELCSGAFKFLQRVLPVCVFCYLGLRLSPKSQAHRVSGHLRRGEGSTRQWVDPLARFQFPLTPAVLVSVLHASRGLRRKPARLSFKFNSAVNLKVEI